MAFSGTSRRKQTPSSLALSAGDDNKNSITTDLAGNPRKVGIIDLGAYEGNVNATFSLLHPTLNPTNDANGNGTTSSGGRSLQTLSLTGTLLTSNPLITSRYWGVELYRDASSQSEYPLAIVIPAGRATDTIYRYTLIAYDAIDLCRQGRMAEYEKNYPIANHDTLAVLSLEPGSHALKVWGGRWEYEGEKWGRFSGEQSLQFSCEAGKTPYIVIDVSMKGYEKDWFSGWIPKRVEWKIDQYKDMPPFFAERPLLLCRGDQWFVSPEPGE